MRLRTGTKNLRRKTVKAFAAVGTVLVALWAGAGLFLYLAPAENKRTHTAALLVLAPTDGRLEYAELLMDKGYADALVISVPPPEYGVDEDVSCDPNRSYPVMCFQPDPITTQGEARGLQRLVSEHGWTSITVVTDKSHAPRAGLLVARCFSGEVNLLSTPDDLPLVSLTQPRGSWAYRYTYETAAFVKMLLNPGC